MEREQIFKTYTSEAYGYTIRYSDKYSVEDAEALGIKECDFVIKNDICTFNVVTTDNDGATNTTPNLKEELETALDTTFNEFETATINDIPTVYYSFTKDGVGFMQMVYFTEDKIHTATLTVSQGADVLTVSDMAFTLISLTR